jgi:hypothetical protein
MVLYLTDPATPRDKTPYIESEALKKHLAGVRVTASAYPQGREVPVGFVSPQFELRAAAYPGVYLSYAGTTRAKEREVRGRANLMYAPPGFPTDVLVPKDFEDKENTETEAWNLTFDKDKSPYTVWDHPIPYDLDFNITVVTRDYQQMFEIIAQLDEMEKIPARFGGLEVPQDGTIRTLELLGGPDTSSLKDEDGKRLLQTIYTVRVASEINLYDIEGVQRIDTIDLQVDSSVHTL